MRKIGICALGFLLLLSGMGNASAHPMGNFSISHYAHFRASGGQVRLLYLLDFAEIPTLEEMDTVADGTIQPEEREEFLKDNLAKIQHSLKIAYNGTPLVPHWEKPTLVLRPGSGSLVTALLRMEAVITLPKQAQGSAYRITYEDSNYAERVGWREIVAEADAGFHLEQSNASNADRSHALTNYPTSLNNTAPHDTKASFMVVKGLAPAIPIIRKQEPLPAAQPASNRQDAFTRTITLENLSPFNLLIALFTAFLFGAGHALSPGHGKAMVASYLVGVRGTARHAVMLGLVVTITHTLGIYLLGFVAMFASKYVVSEHLYPLLSLLSGLAIVGLGLALLVQRARLLRVSPHIRTEDADNEERENIEEASIPLSPQEDISFRQLLLLGMSGGALPCPTALIVMLSAIALHRIAFGMLLILVFSLGLAVVLTLIGIFTLRLRQFWHSKRPNIWLTTRLPFISAVLVTGVGLYLVLQTLTNWLRFRV